MKKLISRIPFTFVVMVCALALGAIFHHPASAIVFGGLAGAILDVQTRLSSSQAVTASAVSTNTYDTLLAGNNLSTGEPMAVLFSVIVAAKLSAGDETYQFQILQSANADLSAPDVLVETVVAYITKAILVAGYQLVLPIPPELITKRYIGVKYVTGGTGPTITVTADMVPLKFATSNAHLYPKNYTITS